MKPTYTIYNQHRGCSIKHPTTTDLDEARRLAESAAQLGYDGLYRVFGPEGFVTAWSVLDGVVTEHKDVTIPERHW